MKKKILIAFIIGLIISGVGVYATILINANEVSYNNSTVKDKLDDLYTKAAEIKSLKKFCELKSGSKYGIGSKYECVVGYDTNNNNTEIKYNFYVLTVRKNSIDLIMERNISDTVGSSRKMKWSDAMSFIDNNNLRSLWSNVIDINLPSAQAIANAAGRDEWNLASNDGTWWCFGSQTQDSQTYPNCTTSNQEKYAWLYNHLTGCLQAGCTDASGATSTGYWTRDLRYNTDRVWTVYRDGSLYYDTITYANGPGVRPVITVSKNNLY